MGCGRRESWSTGSLNERGDLLLRDTPAHGDLTREGASGTNALASAVLTSRHWPNPTRSQRPHKPTDVICGSAPQGPEQGEEE